MGLNNSKPQCLALSKALAIRRHVTDMYVHLGAIAGLVNTHSDHASIDQAVTLHLRNIIQCVLRISHSLCFDMKVVVTNKIALNKQKYPANLCRSAADKPGIDKYWTHCWYTGISKGTPCIVLEGGGHLLPQQTFDVYEQGFHGNAVYFNNIVLQFAEDRHWLAKYTASNTFMALSSEVGELAEHFHWLPSAGDKSTAPTQGPRVDNNAVAGELADVLIYCLHFLRLTGGCV